MKKRGDKPKYSRKGAQRGFAGAGAELRLSDQLALATSAPRAESIDDVIPEAKSPDPRALQVKLPPRPGPPSNAEVADRARALLRERGARARPFGADVSPDDALVIRSLGFAGGGPVPFTARDAEPLLPDEELLPGMREAFVGKKVGESAVAKVTLPEGVPGQPFHGPMNLACEIVSARPLFDGDLDDAAVARAGLAPDARTWIDRVRSLVIAERDAEWRAQARLEVLHAALQQQPVRVPDDATRVVITETWREREQPVLERFGCSEDEQAAMLDAWCNNALIIDETRRRLATTAVVRAWGMATGVQGDPKAAIKRALEYAPELDDQARIELTADLLLSELPDAGAAAHWYAAALDSLIAAVRG